MTTLDLSDPFEKIVAECVELRRRKNADYQSANSSVRQAMHYRRGLSTLHDMVNQKVLRAQSLVEKAENDPPVFKLKEANFESLADTYKDIVNYAVFCVMWINRAIDGQQSHGVDLFNRKINMGSITLATLANNSLSDALSVGVNSPPEAAKFKLSPGVSIVEGELLHEVAAPHLERGWQPK